jgi:hypothetical protein
VRQFAKVVDGGGRVFADLVELGCEFGRVDTVAEQRQLDLGRSQPLLCAVVKVAFDLAPLRFARSDDPTTRALQLGGLRTKLGFEASTLERHENRLACGPHELRIGFQPGVVHDVCDRLPAVLEGR